MLAVARAIARAEDADTTDPNPKRSHYEHPRWSCASDNIRPRRDHIEFSYSHMDLVAWSTVETFRG